MKKPTIETCKFYLEYIKSLQEDPLVCTFPDLMQVIFWIEHVLTAVGDRNEVLRPFPEPKDLRQFNRETSLFAFLQTDLKSKRAVWDKYKQEKIIITPGSEPGIFNFWPFVERRAYHWLTQWNQRAYNWVVMVHPASGTVKDHSIAATDEVMAEEIFRCKYPDYKGKVSFVRSTRAFR